MNSNLKLSIITVTLNRYVDFNETLQSIIYQKNIGKNIEYIVIDGGSEDGTLNLCYQNNKYIDVLISEKDNGLYDAMNKGAAISTGELLLFLNSGDKILYLDPCLPNLTSSSFYFNICKNKFYRSPLSKAYLSRNTVCHQSIFYKRNNFVLYPLNYGIFGDYIQSLNYASKKPVFNNSIIYFDYPSLSFETNNKKNIFNNYLMRLKYVYKYFGLLYLPITIVSFLKKFFFK